ncbi:PhzF family phenazine biosynthesis protein [Paucibacter sp. R3-3]|uniref:PhzF family phenazine biosynthesis protein n=1 Tax=Roseateles agri TaxID=3098619 RepID=A0ABU5DFE9_9BURK|nr:PhzF family phenazine biosynthesis protein [Paucibacter sp. R3-3]MDY0745009.1 PhzF family phenazine biosynthesis protein [Paucibacter sp. R3-3]
MSELRRFVQVDVFGGEPLMGNPLAVVIDGAGLSDEQMAAFACWTNLSETSFLLPPTDPGADYRVRIFTPERELPFAGHPTLGSAHAFLASGGDAKKPGQVVQQCAVGLVRLRRDGSRLAFAAPPLKRTGPLDAALLARIAAILRVREDEIVAHQWADNGPGWCAVMLASGAAVRAIDPDWSKLEELQLGVVGPQRDGEDTDFEIRALIGTAGSTSQPYEDPVTGSLNASVAQWLQSTGLAGARYTAAQGAALNRAGRIHVLRDGDDTWIGGDVHPLVHGQVRL